jgi:hypothetical protein
MSLLHRHATLLLSLPSVMLYTRAAEGVAAGIGCPALSDIRAPTDFPFVPSLLSQQRVVI